MVIKPTKNCQTLSNGLKMYDTSKLGVPFIVTILFYADFSNELKSSAEKIELGRDAYEVLIITSKGSF